MGRTIIEIKKQITTVFIANETIIEAYGLLVDKTFEEQFSLVSVENILFDIISYSIYFLELLFNTHTTEIDTAIYNQKAGTLPWYRTKALAFQYGFDLITDTDKFDNGDATDEDIEASKIIKYAAVTESEDSSRVILKIAGEINGVLTNFTDNTELEAIEAYVDEIRIAGVQVTIINYLADKLYLNLRIKRDPLVLNDQGMNIEDTGFPVIEALNEFMKELEFNGELKLSALIDKIQLISGVLDATVLSAESAWIDAELKGYGTPQPINISKIAESGYFEIVTFDNIEYYVV